MKVIEGLLHEIINSIIIKGDCYFMQINPLINIRTFITYIQDTKKRARREETVLLRGSVKARQCLLASQSSQGGA